MFLFFIVKYNVFLYIVEIYMDIEVEKFLKM